MSKPKFEVGEVVRVVDISGHVIAESSMIVGYEYFDNEPLINVVTGEPESANGFCYEMDVMSEGVNCFAIESELFRIPPPQKTWEQLREELNNPSTRELS